MRSLLTGGEYVTVGGHLTRLLQILVMKGWLRKIYKKSLHIVALKPNQDLAYEQLYKADKITPIIDGPHQLTDTPKLIQYFGERRNTGKIIVAPWD